VIDVVAVEIPEGLGLRLLQKDGDPGVMRRLGLQIRRFVQEDWLSTTVRAWRWWWQQDERRRRRNRALWWLL